MSNPFKADGHRLIFKISKDELIVDRIDCPHDSGSRGICNSKGRCVVKTFIGVYAMDFCVGEALIDGPMEIAWMPVYGDSDLDQDIGAIYFTPVNDKEYMESIELERFKELAG